MKLSMAKAHAYLKCPGGFLFDLDRNSDLVIATASDVVTSTVSK